MKIFKLLVSCLLLLLMTSCAAIAENNARYEQMRALFHRTIPVCSGEAQCKVMWERAQLWIVQHSKMRLAIATDVLIQTHDDPDGIVLTMKATKEPIGQGKYRIVFDGGCYSAVDDTGCWPRKYEVGIVFNDDLNKSL